MTRIPTGDDIGIDDIDVRRITSQRSGKDPIIVEYGGAIIRVINGPVKNTWGARELVLADMYDLDRTRGNVHDAIATDHAVIRPNELKTTTVSHHGRRRDGALILRGHQHDLLLRVPDHLQTDNGFADTGDYVCAVYDRLDDLIVLLDNVRLSARDLDRFADPSFYSRGERGREASVEWTDVPGLSSETMHARLDATDTYLRALGIDPDMYSDEIQRVRERVADVQADQAEQDQGRDGVEETMQT